MSDVTRLLDAAAAGDRQAAAELLPLVYDELRTARRRTHGRRGPRAHARRHRPGPRGVPAAGRPGRQRLDGRGHFFAAAAEAMRRILVESARSTGTAEAGRRTGPASSCSTRPAPSPRIRTCSCRWTNCSPGSAEEDAAAARARPPAPVRRPVRRGGGRRRWGCPGRSPTGTGSTPGPGSARPWKNNSEIRETLFPRMGH